MPQLSLYLDDVAMAHLRTSAEREGISLSRYAKSLIEQDSSPAWPASFWSTYGALKDDSFTVPEELDFALDAPRASFDD